MAVKQMLFDQNAAENMSDGLSQLASAVKVTLGPTGRNVLLQKSWGAPRVTKDGVSVSKEIELPQPFENMGAKMINEVAKKVSEQAGDGTTTATVLAHAIFRQGLKYVSTGANPVAIQRGINDATVAVGDAIDAMAVDCDGRADLLKVATVSANHDTVIGGVIADAIAKVGPDGVVEVEEGKTAEITLHYVEGMSFDKGFLSPYFMTDPKKAEAIKEWVSAVVIGDIADRGALKELFSGVDAVIHLVNVPGGEFAHSMQSMVGTYNVFEAARRAGVKRMVFASSGATVGVYENPLLSV